MVRDPVTTRRPTVSADHPTGEHHWHGPQEVKPGSLTYPCGETYQPRARWRYTCCGCPAVKEEPPPGDIEYVGGRDSDFEIHVPGWAIPLLALFWVVLGGLALWWMASQ